MSIKKRAKMVQKPIVVVSGLPRSGTSMMMKMLEAGGIPILTDNIREPDEDNPKGYYEFEKVKQIKTNSSWLNKTQGKAVKIVSELLQFLPSKYHYKIIFMNRKMSEILASQQTMLARRNKSANPIKDKKLADLFHKHIKKIKLWLNKQANIKVLDVNYNEVLKNPKSNAERIQQFLERNLNIKTMINVVDPKLYRQRVN